MFHETEWQATLEGEGRFQTISNQEKANKVQCFERAINSNWRRRSESAIFSRRCTTNMPDFIGYSSKNGLIRTYLF
jgi:hypothetical protein